MIEPIAGGPLPTMGRSSQGNGGNNAADTTGKTAAAPVGMAAASAELLESLPPLLAYGVTGRLLTNGNQHTRKKAAEAPAKKRADDEHVDQEA